MRLTTRTNLAMRTLMMAALNPDRLVRKAEVARTCNVSENHLALVIQKLARDGLLDTTRGRRGGFTLGRAPKDITVGKVFRLFEAESPFTECFGEDNTCPLACACPLKDALADALDAFYARLDKITLASLVEDNGALEALLRLKGSRPLPGSCTVAEPA